MRLALLAVLALAPLFVLACGDDDSTSAPTAVTKSSPPVALTATSAAPSATTPATAASPAATPTATAPATGGPTPPASVNAPATAALSVTSSAFTDGGNVPVEYSCDGKSSSPPIAWQAKGAQPANVRSFALILHDPDAGRAGGFTHWVVPSIPLTATSLAAGASPGGSLPAGSVEGNNGSGKAGYTGPCPPKGGAPHHYQFLVYALDTTISAEAGKTKESLEQAIAGHVVAWGALTGMFGH